MLIQTQRLIIVLLFFTVFTFSPVFCFAANAPLYDVRVSGTVMDYEAKSVAEADVYIYELHYAYAEGRKLWKSLGKTETDSQGKYLFETKVVDSENIWAVAYKQGLALGYECAINESMETELLIQLDKPGILAGTVLDENREPITNAKLQLCLSSDNRARGRDITIPVPEELFWTNTDSQGRFSFTHIPQDTTADFFVQAPGKTKLWTFWEKDVFAGKKYVVGRKDIEIVLKDESRIEGRVVNEDSGQGISGVTLLARTDKGQANYYCPYKTISGQDGKFQMDGLPADDYFIQVVAPYEGIAEWAGKDIKVTVEPGQIMKDIEVPVYNNTIIEVSVKDAITNEPVKGARVQIDQKSDSGRHPCYYNSIYSDENGNATFKVPPGECKLSASSYLHEYFQDPELINAIKGQILHKELILSNKPSVSGIVTDKQDKPVENVIVTTKPRCERAVVTGAQGRFDLRWYFPAQVKSEKCFLMARDMENNRASIVEITEETGTKNITLEPACTITGLITDPNGRGIPMAGVSLNGIMLNWLTSIRNKVYTDERGKYEIKAVPVRKNDVYYRLEVNAMGYGPGEISIDTKGDSNTPVVIKPIVLQPADQTINGIVVDENGQPLSGLEILVRGPSGMSGHQPERDTVTDKNGRFFVSGLCKSPLRIQAGMGGRDFKPGFLRANGGDKDVKIVLGQESVHSPYQSLISKSLPDINNIGIEVDGIEDKIILVCFCDIEQRPSRNCIMQLNNKAEELKEKNIEIIAIQASAIEREILDEWLEEYNVSFPVGMIQTDVEKMHVAWGVKALPWLILTDKNHVVTSEGFSINELDEAINDSK